MKTTELVWKSYFWHKITHEIQNYIKFCQLYKRIKAFRSASLGHFHSLSVPFQTWQDISVDYITLLPICEQNGLKYHYIAVVICRFTKIKHFIPTIGLIAAKLADAFIARIYVFHGAPNTVISD
jgi:hypothetical protein